VHIAVIGTGYVGLVTGACFTEMGNHVMCVDVDENKLARLRRGEMPIYEPGLEPIVESAVANGLLRYTNSIAEALVKAEYVFIAVGTPPGEDGSADLQYVLAAARSIGEHLHQYVVVVDKSTVPVGTAEKVHATIAQELARRGVDIPFDVVSNPEFLKEGAAVEDFMRPDRVIVGSGSERAQEKMSELYAPYLRSSDRLIFMGLRDAEMTKYAANAMLATRISFMNEVANLCDRMGIDVENVRKGIGSDRRIGYAFIYPGCGYGGSCFPKDVKALIHMSRSQDFEPSLMEAVEVRNQQQKQILFEKISRHFDGELRGKQIGVWGLAFKPGTDDMREAPSVVLIKALIEAGARVKAYDPIALETAEREFPPEWLQDGRLALLKYQYDVLKDADAMALLTEWKRFRQPDFDAMKDLMRNPVVFDGRNQYDPKTLSEHGFCYFGIGRSSQPVAQL
jgi:UDPglucose 6-dehydrogenase